MERPALEFTHHSIVRMEEYGINPVWVEHLWQRAKEYRPPASVRRYKNMKYGRSLTDRVSYFRRCGYMLTVKMDDPPLLLTITKIFSGNIKII